MMINHQVCQSTIIFSIYKQILPKKKKSVKITHYVIRASARP